VQKLAEPGTEGNGHNIMEAFKKRVNKLMLELKIQCRPSFAKKENWPLIVTTVSDPARAAFGNNVMPDGSPSTDITTATCDAPSSNITNVLNTPELIDVNVQIPESGDDTLHSNIEFEVDMEHLHKP
jgi:hypothetical protein